MFRNILLSAIASLKRKKMASLFTILTISLGMTMVVLIASLYHSYTGNVGPYVNRDRCLYLSNLEFEKGEKVARRNYSDGTNASVNFINETLKKIETPCLVGFYGRIETKNFGSTYKPFRIKSMETDANFWKIHRFNFIDGKPFSEEDIDNKARIAIISRKVAMQLFGDCKVVGQYMNTQGGYKIVGVIDDVNPHFEVGADFYLPYAISVYSEDESFKDNNGNPVYYNRGKFIGVVCANSKSDFSRIKREFNKIIVRMNQTGQVEEFDKVNVSLKTAWQLIPSFIGLNRKVSATIIFVSMALIFLLLPIIILSNVNLYALRERLEEIGLRRSFGATRKDIVRQFFAENTMITAIGCLVALFLTYWLNHALAYILYRSSEIPGFGFNLPLFLYLVIGIVIFSLLTIVIPVWRISRIQPVDAIHQNDASHSSFFHFRRRKKWMQMATYFLLSLVLFMCSYFWIISSNSISPLGYETKNVLRIMVAEPNQKDPYEKYDDQLNSTHFEGFRERLLRIQGVEMVSYILENPPLVFWNRPQYQDLMIGDEYKNISTLETDSVFFDLLEIKPVKGRVYSSEVVDENYLPVVTTLAGEKELFNGNAVGQVIQRKADGQKLKIIGVIKKYKNQPGDSEFKGIMICRNRPSRSVLVKVNPDAKMETIHSQIINIANNWKGNRLTILCNDNMDVMKQEEMKVYYSMIYAMVLAVSFLFLNVFLGYFTLNYYNVKTRKKEMGIRRVTGASRPRILQSILGENLSTMLTSFLIAFVILWQLLYLSGFPLWEIFWQAVWLTMIISLILTIGSAILPALIASKVQPVEALAEE